MTKRKIRMKPGEVALLGILLACLLVAGWIERLVALDFLIPGARLGLANVVVLAAVYLFRFGAAGMLVILKCVMTAAFAGGPSAFLYGFAGSILSFFAMWIAVKIFAERVSPVGVSVLGAACHSVGQTAVACAVMSNIGVVAYLPPLLILSVVSGVAVGLLVKSALPRLKAAERGGLLRKPA